MLPCGYLSFFNKSLHYAIFYNGFFSGLLIFLSIAKYYSFTSLSFCVCVFLCGLCVVVKTNSRCACSSYSSDLTTQDRCMLGAVQYVGQAGAGRRPQDSAVGEEVLGGQCFWSTGSLSGLAALWLQWTHCVISLYNSGDRNSSGGLCQQLPSSVSSLHSGGNENH